MSPRRRELEPLSATPPSRGTWATLLASDDDGATPPLRPRLATVVCLGFSGRSSVLRWVQVVCLTVQAFSFLSISLFLFAHFAAFGCTSTSLDDSYTFPALFFYGEDITFRGGYIPIGYSNQSRAGDHASGIISLACGFNGNDMVVARRRRLGLALLALCTTPTTHLVSGAPTTNSITDVAEAGQIPLLIPPQHESSSSIASTPLLLLPPHSFHVQH